MKNLENVLTNLPKNIKFCSTKSSFHQQLTEDIGIIKNIKTTLTFAGKILTFIKSQRTVQKASKQCYHDILQKNQQENTRPEKQPRKKHTEEQGSNKEDVC